MRKILFSLAAILLTSVAFAQAPQQQNEKRNFPRVQQHQKGLSADEMALIRTERLAKTLKLTDSQKAKVLELNKKMAKEFSEKGLSMKVRSTATCPNAKKNNAKKGQQMNCNSCTKAKKSPKNFKKKGNKQTMVCKFSQNKKGNKAVNLKERQKQMKKMQELWSDYQKDLKKILTPEQLKKLPNFCPQTAKETK